MAAPHGNRNGANGTAWKEALRMALVRYESKEQKIERGQALERIARVVVKQALEGNPQSIQEIGNRLDGKPHQSLGIELDDVRDKSREELLAVGKSLGMTEAEIFSESEPSTPTH